MRRTVTIQTQVELELAVPLGQTTDIAPFDGRRAPSSHGLGERITSNVPIAQLDKVIAKLAVNAGSAGAAAYTHDFTLRLRLA